MTQLKSALTFQQQLYHLKNDKNLIIGNERNALIVLTKENYYRISGYALEFKKKDKFIDGTTFEQIYHLYKTDKVMRTILFELINDIEIYLKSQLANYFSLKYGPDGYRDVSNFKNSVDAQVMIDKCDEMIKKKPNHLVVKHHVNKYGGILPLWAMIEMMSFGNVSKFFMNLKTKDKKEICRSAFKDIPSDKLENFYHCLVYFRNECCHYARLYMMRHAIQPKLYKPSTFVNGTYDYRSTYSFILILLYVNPNKKLGEKAIAELKKLKIKSKVDFVSKYGFDPKWRNNLYKANGHCIKYN